MWITPKILLTENNLDLHQWSFHPDSSSFVKSDLLRKFQLSHYFDMEYEEYI